MAYDLLLIIRYLAYWSFGMFMKFVGFDSSAGHIEGSVSVKG